jgi:hypothetical protein
LCEINGDELAITIPATRKRGFQHKCPARVVFSRNQNTRPRLQFFPQTVPEFVEKNPGSWLEVLTTDIDDQQHFNGFLYCLQSQVQRIVTSGYKKFAADAVFINPEHSGFDGWSLCNLTSRDPNGNLVCLASCLCPKENAEAHRNMFDKVMDIKLATDPDPHTFREVLDIPDALILSDRGKGEDVTTRLQTHCLYIWCVVWTVKRWIGMLKHCVCGPTIHRVEEGSAGIIASGPARSVREAFAGRLHQKRTSWQSLALHKGLLETAALSNNR